VAIRDCPSGTEPPGAVRLIGERMCPVASPEYLRHAKAPLAVPEDLRNHVILQLHDPQGRWPYLGWAPWYESHGMADLLSESTLTFNQYDQLISAALHGQGVALGRMTLVSSLIAEGRLVALFDQDTQVPRAFHAVYAPGATQRPEAQAFVQWVKREIAEENPPQK
jgi:LysR family glycine cleavage system transcriptional activator